MNLVGKKVILRAIEETDIELLRQALNDPEMEKVVVGWALPISKKHQMDWFQNEKNSLNNIRFIISRKEDNKALGMISLNEIDYKNGTAVYGIKIFYINNRKQGFAYDALMVLLKYAFFELRLNRIQSDFLSYNIDSIKLAEKCGFKMEGIKRGAVYKNGKFNDVVIGGCLKSDYEEKIKENNYWDDSEI